PRGSRRLGPVEAQGAFRRGLRRLRLAPSLRRPPLGSVRFGRRVAALGRRGFPRGGRGRGLRVPPEARLRLRRCRRGRVSLGPAPAVACRWEVRRGFLLPDRGIEPRRPRVSRLLLPKDEDQDMKAAWVAAERESAVREAARAWRRAGAIDDAALSAI